MPAKLRQSPTLDRDALARHEHVLFVAPGTEADAASLRDVPEYERMERVLRRRGMKAGDMAKCPNAFHAAGGALCACVVVDRTRSRFEQHAALRRGLALLLEESPRSIAIAVVGDAEQRLALARDALYVAWLNGVRLPARKKKPDGKPLDAIQLHGAPEGASFNDVAALARGNTLARELTALPPNELTPAAYRVRLHVLAKRHGWQCVEYGFKRLRRMGAGAFTAVARGSHEEDAAIVHLSYVPRRARARVALVGKGICFDTGGHNLKSAKYMAGMHEDMNGSAVALGIMQVLAELRRPVRVDAWLAIAENHLSPLAYKQGEIVTALDGTTVEIVHTDAEGRLVLADTLTLAARGEGGHAPDLMIDFATLTGSMIHALGNRQSGVFASDDALAALAVAAGRASGERVCLFPMDSDYESALESKVADVKQCTLEGEADHILAACFLRRFTGARPWLHLDLSAANCSGGLGAAASDITGFGVAWGVELLDRWSEAKPL
jgi:leucyl aminopeptidase